MLLAHRGDVRTIYIGQLIGLARIQEVIKASICSHRIRNEFVKAFQVEQLENSNRH